MLFLVKLKRVGKYVIGGIIVTCLLILIPNSDVHTDVVGSRLPLTSSRTVNAALSHEGLLRQSTQNSIVNEVTKRVGITDNKSSNVGEFDNRNITTLRSTVTRLNALQNIQNAATLSRNFSTRSDSVVVVVQIHDRVEYLEKLLLSLSRVSGINSCLVILSHDFVSDELAQMTSNISFPFMHIYYPYSLQLYPDVYPGSDPKDCARHIGKSKALETGCKNAKFPDIYGNYREAHITQTKHHWIWKLHRIFNLDILKYFSGHVLLLEEDHYVSEDMLHVLNKMVILKNTNCADCDILTLGKYEKVLKVKPSGNVVIGYWVSSKHNMGMAVDRSFWQRLSTCLKVFCSYDDYNWDWSLQYVGALCFSSKLKCLSVQSSRVFHLGECGLHHNGSICSPRERTQIIDDFLLKAKKFMYPKKLLIQNTVAMPFRLPKPNGGWGDIRDHELCMANTANIPHNKDTVMQ